MQISPHNPRAVIVSADDVAAFKRQWPCSGLSDCAYTFEFGFNGDLVDTDVSEQDDGPAAVALSQDCQTFLETGDLPDWLD